MNHLIPNRKNASINCNTKIKSKIKLLESGSFENSKNIKFNKNFSKNVLFDKVIFGVFEIDI